MQKWNDGRSTLLSWLYLDSRRFRLSRFVYSSSFIYTLALITNETSFLFRFTGVFDKNEIISFEQLLEGKKNLSTM